MENSKALAWWNYFSLYHIKSTAVKRQSNANSNQMPGLIWKLGSCLSGFTWNSLCFCLHHLQVRYAMTLKVTHSHFSRVIWPRVPKPSYKRRALQYELLLPTNPLPTLGGSRWLMEDCRTDGYTTMVCHRKPRLCTSFATCGKKRVRARLCHLHKASWEDRYLL